MQIPSDWLWPHTQTETYFLFPEVNNLSVVENDVLVEMSC